MQDSLLPHTRRMRRCLVSKNPKIANAFDSRRALEYELRDVFRQQRTRYVGRNPFYQLRRDLNDEFVGIALQAVLVANSVVHVMCRLTGWSGWDIQYGGRLLIFNIERCPWSHSA